MAKILNAELNRVIQLGQRADISESDIEKRFRLRIYDPVLRKECNYRLVVIMNYVREINPDDSGFGDSTETMVRGYMPADIAEYNELRERFKMNQQAEAEGDPFRWNSAEEPIFHVYLVDQLGHANQPSMLYAMKQVEFEAKVKSKSPRKF